MRIFFLALGALAFSLVVYLFFYLGFYKSVAVAEERRGPLYLLSKPHTGAYHEIGATIREVETWASQHNLPCSRTYGEYLDNPESVDQDRLRSRGGCLLDQPLGADQKPDLFTYEVREPTDFVVAKFRGSPAIGPFKAYPAAENYFREHRLTHDEPVIEIYLVDGDRVTTEYLFKISRKP